MNHETIIFCDPEVSGADGIDIVKGKLTLSSKVKVYTLGGQLIYEGEGSNFQLKSGTYVIKTDKGSIKRAYK